MVKVHQKRCFEDDKSDRFKSIILGQEH